MSLSSGTPGFNSQGVGFKLAVSEVEFFGKDAKKET